MIKDKIKHFKNIVLFSILISTNTVAEKIGDLTRQSPITKSVSLKGKIGISHYFEPNVLSFNTGKLYKLRIINNSDSKHYFSSSKFSQSIFTRKIQILKNGEKISEIKGNITEVEVFPNNIIEWWFVPIKTGKFKDLKCEVKDSASKESHSKMGMVGTIIIN